MDMNGVQTLYQTLWYWWVSSGHGIMDINGVENVLLVKQQF